MVPSSPRALPFYRFSLGVSSFVARHIDCFGGFLVGRPVSDFYRRPASSGPAATPLPCLASSCEWRVLRSARGRAIVVMGVASFFACRIIHSRACFPSGQPFFFGGFRVFLIATRKCVCMYVTPPTVCEPSAELTYLHGTLCRTTPMAWPSSWHFSDVLQFHHHAFPIFTLICIRTY